jgi:hypothetical protein
MGDAQQAMKDVRDAACALSLACLAHIPVQILRDAETLRYLAPAPKEFEELLNKLA